MAEAKDKTEFEITNLTKGKLPRLPFLDLKNAILGKKYSLSLVIIGDALSKKLNNSYRGKNLPTNILSFPLSKNEGEIFLNLKRARIESVKFGEKYGNFVGFLFIHGLLHLNGMTHGSRMERQEQKLKREFGL
jgi:probable rRNA maturation factor